MSNRHDFQAWDNEDLSISIGIDASGVAMDLSGYTAFMQARTSEGATGVAITSASGTTTLATGSLQMSIPAAVMATIDPGEYQYDLLLSDSTSARRLIWGTLTLSRGVTR